MTNSIDNILLVKEVDNWLLIMYDDKHLFTFVFVIINFGEI